MKKLVASVGLVAFSATALQAQQAPGLTRTEASKPWSISASLRGFYDDNYTTSPNDFAMDTFGFEFSPRVELNIPLDTTFIGLSYTYSLIYYEDRDDDPIDHQHEFEGVLDHSFSERYSLRIEDSFVYSQEPEVIDQNLSFPLRTDSDTIRNRGKIRFRGAITEVFGLEAGYQNTLYDYTDDGPGSRSALLDRLEHLFNVDGRYTLQRDLTAIVGYQFGIVSYTGDDFISPFTLDMSDVRDNKSHYFYLGGEYQLSRTFSGILKVGAQYTDYDNVDESTWGPYLDLSGVYTYLPGSYVRFGVRHARNPTDIVGTSAEATLDQESTILYGSVSHRITPQLTGSLVGQFQTAEFNGGSADGDIDNYYAFGANLTYAINQYWSTELGYNYDRLDSDLPFRSFSRNRVYLGVRAAF